MALDEPKTQDKTYEVSGIKFYVEGDLISYTNGFNIDYKSSLFGKRFYIEPISGARSSCR